MNLHELLSSPWVGRVGWTLLHSLWEIAAVAGLLWIVLALLRRGSPQVRYLAAGAGMGVMLVVTIATFLAVGSPMSQPLQPAPPSGEVVQESMPLAQFQGVEQSAPVAPPLADTSAEARAPVAPPVAAVQPWAERCRQALEPYLPWLVAAWVTGVLALSVWRAGGWLAAYRLRVVGTEPVGPDIEALTRRLADRLGLRRAIRVMQSVLVQTPMVIGWLRPVVLLPLAAVTGLTPGQLEAILAHELAHVRRLDYLVNLLQAAMEILFFYHPVVWWISRRMRVERERCCDDVAVAICCDRVGYVEALAAVEEARQPLGGAMVAARGSGGTDLLARARRLLGLPDPGTPASARSGLAVLACAVAVAACLWVNVQAEPPGSRPVRQKDLTISELLEGYKANQDQVKGYIVKARQSQRGEGILRGQARKDVHEQALEVRYDGNRLSHRRLDWGDNGGVGPYRPQERAEYNSLLYDGNRLFSIWYQPNEDRTWNHVLVSDADDRARRSRDGLMNHLNEGVLRGYLHGDTARLDEVLKEGKASLRKELGEGGRLLYVIEETGKRGIHKVWIDPERGYNVVRSEIVKGPGHLFGDQKPMSPGYRVWHKMTNVRLEQIDGLWLPVEADFEYERTAPASDPSPRWTSRTHYKRTSLVINPRWDQIDAFSPDDVRDGAELRYTKFMQLVFRWTGGTVVPGHYRKGPDGKFSVFEPDPNAGGANVQVARQFLQDALTLKPISKPSTTQPASQPGLGRLVISAEGDHLSVKSAGEEAGAGSALEVYPDRVKMWSGTTERVNAGKLTITLAGCQITADGGKLAFRHQANECVAYLRDGKVHMEMTAPDGKKSTMTGRQVLVDPAAGRIEAKGDPAFTEPPATQPGEAPQTNPAATEPGIAGPAWIRLLPASPIRSLAEYHNTYQAGPITEAKVDSVEFEIRSAKDQKRIARFTAESIVLLPTNPANGRLRRGWTTGGGGTLTESESRLVGTLPDGEYLVAVYVNGVRCSNVGELRIDKACEPGRDQPLRLVRLEPPPGQATNILGIVGTGPTPKDEKFIASSVAFCSLVVDGVERKPRSMSWVGPDGPLAPGQQFRAIRSLDNYAPPIELDRQHVVIAKVGQYVSAPVMVFPGEPLGQAWDRITSTLPQPAVLLGGRATGSDGKPAVRFEVSLLSDDGQKAFHERADDAGKYRFINVPPGTYKLACNPPGQGQPVLVLKGVAIQPEKVLQQDMSLERKFILVGRITHADGKAAANMTVDLSCEDCQRNAEFMDTTQTDDQGRYEIGSPLSVVTYVGVNGGRVGGTMPLLKPGQNRADYVLQARDGRLRAVPTGPPSDPAPTQPAPGGASTQPAEGRPKETVDGLSLVLRCQLPKVDFGRDLRLDVAVSNGTGNPIELDHWGLEREFPIVTFTFAGEAGRRVNVSTKQAAWCATGILGGPLAPGKNNKESFRIGDCWDWGGGPPFIAPGRYRVTAEVGRVDVDGHSRVLGRSAPLDVEVLQWPEEQPDGVRLLARPLKHQNAWEAGQTPQFETDLHNEGTRNLRLMPFLEHWQIEVDGTWYHATVVYTGDVEVRPLAPGQGQTNVPFSPDQRWGWRSQAGNQLVFRPGKHVVRLALTVFPANGAAGKPVRPVSNPVELAINLPAGASQPAVRAPSTGSGQDASPQATLPAEAWGATVEGCQVGLHLEKRQFRPGEPVSLRWAIRNAGTGPRAVVWQDAADPCPAFFQIARKGAWTVICPEASRKDFLTDRPPPRKLTLEPGQTQEVTLPMSALLLDSPAPGVYELTGIYAPAEALKDLPSRAELKGAVAARVYSRVLEFEIMPPDLTGPLAWGQAADGLQCAVRPVKPSFRPDEDIVAEVIYRNVAREPITVCTARDPLYTWVHLDVLEGGTRVLSGLHGSGARYPLGPWNFATLKPGQAASFRQVIQHNSQPQHQLRPGQYSLQAEINKINRMDKHLPDLAAVVARHDIPKPWCSGIESGLAPVTIAAPATQVGGGQEPGKD